MPATKARPKASGVYLVRDAALLVSVTAPTVDVSTAPKASTLRPSTRHLYRWVNEGLGGRYLEGLHRNDVALTFLDLISMRMIAAMRSVGLRPRDILDAHKRLEVRLGWSHPFAMQPIWAQGPVMVIREAGIPFDITRPWQRAFDFILEYLTPIHDLVFGPDEVPRVWTPRPGITLDPGMRMGEPCIEGTRIPTDVIWGFNQAGESVAVLSATYDVEPESIQAAISWEEELAKAA